MPKIEKLATENLTVATFRIHSVKNEAKSKKAGRPIFDDMEVCELRFAANKQTVGVFPAHEIFKWDTDPVSGDREPVTYALEYPEQYKRFKNGEAQVASGTPLSELPFLTQGKRLELKALNIHTAEALSALDGYALKQLGQGGRTLKEQAQAYIDKAAGTADVSDQAARIAALEDEIRRLKSGSSDADSEVAGSTDLGSEPPAAGLEQSPFFIMDRDDIVNWLFETTGKKPTKTLKHAALVKLADEVNAELAKAKGTEAA